VRLAIGGAVVLDGVDATVPPRGVTCLLGPSGAGKSTLLRLCNRLTVPDRGTVSFRGQDVAGLDPLALRRRVGMVFQRPTLFGGTVRHNLRVAAPDADDATLVDVLTRTDLDPGFLDRQAESLSGGEAQRLCLARTLVTRPEALLMDEPTSALDPASRRSLEQLARRLCEHGVPLLWVTHDLAQAGRLADEVLVVIAGRIALAGTMEDVTASDDPAVVAFRAAEASRGPEEEPPHG
jgi:putative ABC transport system ATP-binding protein